MKRKFKTTDFNKLIFVDLFDHLIEYQFSDLYDYIGNLGAGAFGFVVSAVCR